MTACSAAQAPEPEPYAERVAGALQSGQALPGWGGAGVLGQDGPQGGLAELPHTVEVVKVGPVQESQDGPSTAEVTLDWSWQVGTGPEQTWDYRRSVRIELQQREDQKARWTSSPDASWLAQGVDPSGQLSVRTTPAERADIVDADGAPIVTARPVLRLGLDKTRVPEGTEAQLREAAGEVAEVVGLDPGAFADQAVAAGPSAFVEAYSVRGAEPGVDLDALAQARRHRGSVRSAAQPGPHLARSARGQRGADGRGPTAGDTLRGGGAAG